jgi:ATP-dependent helicase YprA (DUF1998 family)
VAALADTSSSSTIVAVLVGEYVSGVSRGKSETFLVAALDGCAEMKGDSSFLYI